jgi:RNA polymerase sigma-70 factor, ECF subfamily
MGRADILSLPGATWETEYLEDISIRRVILDLYDQEHIAIRRYASFLGADPETSREIIQECFLRLHQHLLAGGDRTNLRAWLYRVAHNLVRSGQSSLRVSKTDYLPDVAVAGDIPANTESPEDKILGTEKTRRFHEALNQLSRAQRECLVLRTRGMKYREIGEALNLSTSTVAENVQRGLEKLKEAL